MITQEEAREQLERYAPRGTKLYFQWMKSTRDTNGNIRRLYKIFTLFKGDLYDITKEVTLVTTFAFRERTTWQPSFIATTGDYVNIASSLSYAMFDEGLEHNTYTYQIIT